MYNLHSHSILSDGALLPTEIAMRYFALGYKTIAITDHVDYSNIEFVVESILKFTTHWPKNSPIKVLSGIELTHLPLEQFKPLAQYARSKGIEIIVAHGETLMEPVIKGTNHASLQADIDILAHPGLISDEDVQLAKRKNIFLELTSRKGHLTGNSHVVERALKFGAKLILSNDSHDPEDIIKPDELENVAYKANLTKKDIDKIYLDVSDFLKTKGG